MLEKKIDRWIGFLEKSLEALPDRSCKFWLDHFHPVAYRIGDSLPLQSVMYWATKIDGSKAVMKLLTLLLLGLYVTSSLRIDSIHQLFHTENIAELHSAEKESDPCHKNIYHQQKEGGCEHQSHVTENEKCPICEFTANSVAVLTDVITERISFDELVKESLNQAKFQSPVVGLNDGRAPPESLGV